MKTASRWYSDRVEQEIALVRWGHWGQPVLIFPTAGGDAEEIERMQLIAALRPLIEGGRIKVYSCDNLAGRAFAANTGSIEYRCLLLNRFEEAVAREVVPAIRLDCHDEGAEVPGMPHRSRTCAAGITCASTTASIRSTHIRDWNCRTAHSSAASSVTEAICW